MRIFKERVPGENQNSSVLDEYSNRVFRLVVLIVPFFFLCGNGTMTIMHYMGYYPAVNDIAMWFSNSIDIFYMVVAIYLVKTSYGPDGFLIVSKLPVAKIVLMIMVVLQWNLNSYICPFTDFWAYAPLFVIVEAFFFDVNLVHITTLLIVLSMVISWIFNGENLLPVANEYFYLNLIFRGVGLTFTLFCINIITWFGKVFIIEMVASREKEREMKEKSDEYEREARMKSDFLANMSHEIRTPMNAVIGMAEIAMREDLPPGAVDCLTQIQKSGRNLLNIINDILDYSKIDSGKMEIVSERYEPVSELNDISNILATRLEDKDLGLYIIIDKNIPHALLGDAMRIRQIVINLANNAIKFTKKGRVGVTVSCKYTDENTVKLTYHIKDTGIGISKEDMDKLFVSFQQVDSRRNRSVEGTGLGLAISRSLVEAMGGTIGVDSEYGKGSDFWFTIPQRVLDPTIDMVVNDIGSKRAVMVDGSVGKRGAFMEDMDILGVQNTSFATLEEYRPLSGYRDFVFFEHGGNDDRFLAFLDENPDATGVLYIPFNSTYQSERSNLYTLRRPVTTMKMVRILNDDEEELLLADEAYAINFTAPTAKILIVDDNQINISIAEGLLAPIKMNIDSALSGPEAIRKVQQEDYDIVLMDHMMPGMDGVDTTKVIRETKPTAEDLVIIALSANALKEAREMFLSVGMDDFVAKPIEIKDLVAKIRKWLPEEKIQRGTEQDESTEEDSDILAGFDMLDTEQAVRLLGSPALFRTIAEEYYKAGQGNYDGLTAALENEDIQDFTIRIHALKSSSRQIGAPTLGDKAEALEMAGKDDDLEFIRANAGEALARYRELLDSLADVFAEAQDEDEDLPMIPDEKLRELLGKLGVACEDLDMDSMEELRDELKGYSWPEDNQEDIRALCEAIDGMEIITCEEILEKIVI